MYLMLVQHIQHLLYLLCLPYIGKFLTHENLHTKKFQPFLFCTRVVRSLGTPIVNNFYFRTRSVHMKIKTGRKYPDIQYYSRFYNGLYNVGFRITILCPLNCTSFFFFFSTSCMWLMINWLLCQYCCYIIIAKMGTVHLQLELKV